MSLLLENIEKLKFQKDQFFYLYITSRVNNKEFNTISSSSFSSNTTVNVTWDSGNLSNEAISNVYIGALSKTNDSIPTGISAEKIANGTFEF